MADAAAPTARSVPSAKSLVDGFLRGEMGLALGVVGISHALPGTVDG